MRSDCKWTDVIGSALISTIQHNRGNDKGVILIIRNPIADA